MILRILGLVVLSFMLVPASQAQVVQSAVPTSNALVPNQSRGGGRVATLSEQLKAGLKARRQVEFKFIDEVVKLVRQRKLPVRLVLETFHYARGKRSGYPFQFFQRALAIRAARIGVKLKPV